MDIKKICLNDIIQNFGVNVDSKFEKKMTIRHYTSL